MPTGALLQKYCDQGDPTYTDCFTVVVPGSRPLADLIGAFYTTWLFRLERLILQWFAGRPSTDADVTALAVGTSENFAAWRVEARREDQVLLCDLAGRTRSWLMVQPGDDGTTTLHFGSAVVPASAGAASLGLLFSVLMPAHRLYSRALLSLAAWRLRA